MNTLFWLIIAAMAMIALLLVVLPLLKNQAVTSGNGEQRNLKIARQRLAELKLQRQEGDLSEQQFDEQYAELQQSLNDDLNADGELRCEASSGRWAIPVIGVLLPVLSVLIYFQLGETSAITKTELQLANEQTAAKIQAGIAPLIGRLKQNPEDTEGWIMLGRAYLYLQQFQNAADVFSELLRRQPDNIEAMLSYANSLAMTRNGQLAGEPSRFIYKALQLAPDNQEALWLAGMAKSEEGDAEAALDYFRQLEGSLPPDSEALQQVKQVIAEIKAQRIERATPATSINIPVHVDIDAAIKAKVDAQQTVFIYAQALNGPKMPLAIVRKQVADLPIAVEMNDTMAMQPNLHLADFKRIKIIARVSKTGDAMTQVGDFIGTSELDVSANQTPSPIKITINQEVK